MYLKAVNKQQLGLDTHEKVAELLLSTLFFLYLLTLSRLLDNESRDQCSKSDLKKQ